RKAKAQRSRQTEPPRTSRWSSAWGLGSGLSLFLHAFIRRLGLVRLWFLLLCLAVKGRDLHFNVEFIRLGAALADVELGDTDGIAGLVQLLHEIGQSQHSHLTKTNLRNSLLEGLSVGNRGSILRLRDLDANGISRLGQEARQGGRL